MIIKVVIEAADKDELANVIAIFASAKVYSEKTCWMRIYTTPADAAAVIAEVASAANPERIDAVFVPSDYAVMKDILVADAATADEAVQALGDPTPAQARDLLTVIGDQHERAMQAGRLPYSGQAQANRRAALRHLSRNRPEATR